MEVELSTLEKEIREMGFSLEEVVEAYNHLIFDDTITCNGIVVRLANK